MNNLSGRVPSALMLGVLLAAGVSWVIAGLGQAQPPDAR